MIKMSCRAALTQGIYAYGLLGRPHHVMGLRLIMRDLYGAQPEQLGYGFALKEPTVPRAHALIVKSLRVWVPPTLRAMLDLPNKESYREFIREAVQVLPVVVAGARDECACGATGVWLCCDCSEVHCSDCRCHGMPAFNLFAVAVTFYDADGVPTRDMRIFWHWAASRLGVEWDKAMFDFFTVCTSR